MQKQFEITDDLYASQGQRFANSLLDTVAYYIITIALGVLLGITAQLLDSPELINQFSNIDGFTNILITILITSTYFFVFESLGATTLGKLVTRTIVVDENGNKPNSRQLFIRTFSRLIPFDAFSYLGNPSRGWHDSFSDTYVVKKNDLLAAKELFYSLEQLGSDTENNN